MTEKQTAQSAAAIVPIEKTMEQLDILRNEGASLELVDGFARAWQTGTLFAKFYNAITPKVMEQFMWLQNKNIGFKTDQASGYDMDTVKNCVIEAAMHGLAPVGNEFNIIARQMYIAKEGLRKMLKNIKGLAFSVTPGIPTMTGEKRATTKVLVKWTYQGEKHEQELEFAVKCNSGMGDDGINGKATRKAYKWLYEEITCNTIEDGDVDDLPKPQKASRIEAATVETVDNGKIEQM